VPTRTEAPGIISRLASDGSGAAIFALERTLRDEDAGEGDRLDEVLGAT
jgi:hypothetical protein